MAWIKRNLFFVITVVVGLGLTGYCAYLLFAALGENAAAVTAYGEATNSLHQLQSEKPYPSKENIQVAESDAARVLAFKEEFRKAFAGFPTPPKVDDEQFKEHLQKTIYRFGAEATNAGVGLSPGYNFGFTPQLPLLNYPADCIAPWMQELEEMSAILRILYNAKINFLEHIKRPLVSSQNDASDDYTQLTTQTNQNGVVTPYRVEFRAFSAEIANVLAGIAASSNCFIVKSLSVEKSTVPLPDLQQIMQPTPPPPPVYQQPRPRPPSDLDNPFGSGGRGPKGGDYRMRPQPRMPDYQAPAAPAAPTGPVTILRERPLFVTIYLEVVKLKALETNAPGGAAKLRTVAPK